MALLDERSQQAKEIAQEMETLVNEIDWDEQMNATAELFKTQRESLKNLANTFKKDFSEFVKEVTNKVSDFKVTIPYDPSSEKLEWKVEDGKLKILVAYKSDNVTRTSETLVSIPENSDTESITFAENAAKQTVTFTIPKKLMENKQENTDESNGDEIPTKLKQTLASNIGRVARLVQNGRDFQRREVDEKPAEQ